MQNPNCGTQIICPTIKYGFPGLFVVQQEMYLGLADSKCNMIHFCMAIANYNALIKKYV